MSSTSPNCDRSPCVSSTARSNLVSWRERLGEILAALSLGAPLERMEANRERYVRAVTEAARRASGVEG